MSGLTQLLHRVRRHKIGAGEIVDHGQIVNEIQRFITSTDVSQEDRDLISSDSQIQVVISELQKLWFDAEFNLEVELAQQVVEAGSSAQEGALAYGALVLAQDYRHHIEFDVRMINSTVQKYNLPTIRSIAFIGSGPLPITSIETSRLVHPSIRICNMDRNCVALSLGSAVAKQLDLANLVFEGKDVEQDDLTEIEFCDLIQVAASVGTTLEGRSKALSRVARAMKPQSLLLLRISEGLARIIYPQTELDLFEYDLVPVAALKRSFISSVMYIKQA